MSPEKFEAAMAQQEYQEIDWDDALSTVRILAGMHSHETGISPAQIQLVVAMEELSELSQELSKVVRCRGNDAAVLEELADVSIMVKYVQSAMNISDEDLNRAINVKLGRYSTAVPNTETR